MQIKRLAALSLAAVFTAALLAGCDLLAWLAWLEENSDSSSVTSSPSSSSSISRPSYDDDEDDDDAPSQPPAGPEKPAPDPAKPETWTITDEGKLEVPKDATTIPNEAFKDNNNITSLDLTGTGVTTINKDAFRNCTSLQTVTMGDMDTIGQGAFYSCESLQTVTMGDVTTIGITAFVNCKNLHAVDMGVVRNIGRSAFGGCVNLTSIRFKNDTAGPSVASGAFQGVGVATGGVTVYSDWAVQNRDTVTSWFWPHLSPLQVYTNDYVALTFP